MKKLLIIFTTVLTVFLGSCSNDNELILFAGTTLEGSGFLEYILPHFEEKYDIDVSVIALGTGAALELASTGNADILFVHDSSAELQFIEDGYGVKRDDVMYNDFIFVGPLGTAFDSVEDTLAYISNGEHTFYSRGDLSGTHMKELYIWETSGYNPSTFGSWYNETGQGMSATLSMTNLNADSFTLVDRATYLMMTNESFNLTAVYDDFDSMLNQYGIVLVNSDLHSRDTTNANLFYDWILSEEAQILIAAFRIDNQTVFYVNED
jgi:tungstate transport system substrate-binding protein